MLSPPPALHDGRFKLLRGRPRPDFMVIGAAKSGTTSLASYLARHPRIAPVRFKEPNFFTWQLFGREDYQNLFLNKRRAAPSAVLAGDYSTSYLLHPLAPRRIAARLPEVKCIALLRDPTDRAYSHFIMQQREGVEQDAAFAEIVEREMKEVAPLLAAHRRAFLDPDAATAAHRQDHNGNPLVVHSHDSHGNTYRLVEEKDLFRYYITSYVLRSIYADQIERWMTVLPPEQLLILEAEQLYSEPRATVDRIVDFLELPRAALQAGELEYSLGGGASNRVDGPGEYDAMPTAVRGALDDFFAAHNTRLQDLTGMTFSWA